MKAENRAFLERFRHHYNTIVQAQYCSRHIEQVDLQKMLGIAREEWEPNYRACLTCHEDIYTLVKYVFVQMDKEPLPTIDVVPVAAIPENTIVANTDEGLVKMTFPKEEIKVVDLDAQAQATNRTINTKPGNGRRK